MDLDDILKSVNTPDEKLNKIAIKTKIVIFLDRFYP